jgi:DNA-binding SARP family transcriptional activator
MPNGAYDPMDSTLPAGPDLTRAALVERVRAAGPTLVALAAPAGFGKSSLARRLAAGSAHGAVCDLAGAGTELAVASRLLIALAAEDPTRAEVLAHAEAGLGDDLVSPAERVAVALAAWRAPVPPAWFVLDDLDDAPPELVARLLAERPEQRTVVLCSREPPRLHLSRFAAPHRIVTLRATDLAFGVDEIAEALAGSGADPPLVERVARASAGWPMAVLLLARFAREGRIDALLDRLDDLAYGELHEYLVDQVLASAPPAAIDGLLLCAALANTTEAELQLALGDREASAQFVAYARGSPFVTVGGDGAFAVHPLASSALRAAHAGRLDALLLRLADALRERGKRERAAEAQLARGDRVAAAELLAAVVDLPDGAPSFAYARVLNALEPAQLRAPRLWSTTALLRAFSADGPALLVEADRVCVRGAREAPPATRLALHALRALLATWLGESGAALALVDDLRASSDAAPALAGWLLALRAALTARLGQLGDAERQLESAWTATSGSHVIAGTALLAAATEIARPRGARADERDRLARALERLRAAQLDNLVALGEAEATFGAWLAGEDELAAHHARQLDEAVERDGVRAFAFFAARARGRDAEPAAGDDARWVARGWLLAAAQAPDAATALRCAMRARELALADGAPFPQLLAALALCTLDAEQRQQFAADVALLARRIDAPALHAALARVEDGFLAPFAARYQHPSAAAAAPALAIEIVSGRVLRGGTPLALPEREHALLVALAVRRDAVQRGRLTDALWPDLEEGAARNAFHVCLHRLKARLGDERAIARSDDGYRLGDEVAVDLWEIDRAVAALRANQRLDDAHAARLRALYDRLRASRPPRVEAWDWFEPVERRLRELRCEIAQLLAQRALDAGNPQEALALCHDMIAYDPCDEPTREIAIRAYLASGDRAAALRHYRQYRDVLMSELQCEPSPALAKLVGATT